MSTEELLVLNVFSASILLSLMNNVGGIIKAFGVYPNELILIQFIGQFAKNFFRILIIV